MADTGEARSTARSAVVRPLSRAAGRPCARPGCPSPARATLSFRYDTREAWLGPLTDEAVPAAYDLCGSHADKTRPPHGWGIVDQRPAEDESTSDAPRVDAEELGGEQTVAVLAAALRSVPDPKPVASVAEPVSAEPAAPVEAAVAERPVAPALAISQVDADVRDALAELQSFIAEDRDALEPVSLDETFEELVEDQEELEVLAEAVEELDHLDGRATDEPTASPRPVPAAERRDRGDTAARHW